MTKSTKQIVDERQQTHGDFTVHAHVTQKLKSVMHNNTSWDKLSPTQREALEMIAHKIGRILAGNPNTHDHWDDIAGYAKITSDRIPEDKIPTE